MEAVVIMVVAIVTKVPRMKKASVNNFALTVIFQYIYAAKNIWVTFLNCRPGLTVDVKIVCIVSPKVNYGIPYYNPRRFGIICKEGFNHPESRHYDLFYFFAHV